MAYHEKRESGLKMALKQMFYIGVAPLLFGLVIVAISLFLKAIGVV